MCHINTYTHTCTHTHTHTHTHPHANTHAYIHAHTLIHTYTVHGKIWREKIKILANLLAGLQVSHYIYTYWLTFCQIRQNFQMCSTHTRTNTHIHIHTYSLCNTFTLQIKGKFQCIICNILHWLWNVIEMHDVYQCVCYTVFVTQVYVQFPKIRTLINKMRLLLSKSQKCTNTN